MQLGTMEEVERTLILTRRWKKQSSTFSAAWRGTSVTLKLKKKVLRVQKCIDRNGEYVEK